MIALLDLIPKWVWAALVAALAATSCKLTVDNAGFRLEIEKSKVAVAQLTSEHLAAVSLANEKLAAAQASTRKTEQSLQVAMNTSRRQSNEELSSLAAERDALRVRLQDAITSSSTHSIATTSIAGAAKAPGGGDKPQLSEPLGELIDEAFRADQIRTELLGCYRAYDNAREELAKPIQ